MTRTDDDSWDLASSVGATATMVAAARAVVSREDDPLIVDPFAEPLVRAVGIDFFVRLLDGDLDLDDPEGGMLPAMTAIMAVRTRFFDDFFVDATRAGIGQAVILASGLDARAYRLPWPAGTVVYELDQPDVIAAKTAAMRAIGAEAPVERRTVSVDLRDDWPAALRATGFDDSAPAAWSAEGLLAYLPPQAQDRLFDEITALSAPGSRLATEFHPDGATSIGQAAGTMTKSWRDHGFDVDLSQLFYSGERNAVTDYLAAHGWDVSATRRAEMFASFGRTLPQSDAMPAIRESLSVVATRREGQR